MVRSKYIKAYTLIALLLLGSCNQEEQAAEYMAAEPPPAVQGEKINGLSFVAPPKPIKAEAFDPAVQVNANWMTLIPYGYGRVSEAKLYWNVDWQWWGEKSKGLEACINMAHGKGLKVMVKPQIWFDHGTFTGDVKYDSSKDWESFEQSFEEFILEFAGVAERNKAEMFCIGTEWKEFVKARPDFWKQLIPKVRKVFSGEITYAGNWDSYLYFPHWKDLDYIGIDAYFPLSKDDVPSVAALKAGWAPHVKAIEAESKKHGKPVIFTEYGYRSMIRNAAEPWDSNRGKTVNLEAQDNAYKALFETVWHQPWFKGGFLWKWHHDHSRAGGKNSTRFTPQNKPAEKTLKAWYAKEH